MSATSSDYIACEHCEHHESRSVFGIDPFCVKHLKDNPTPCSQFSPSSWFLRNYGNIVVRRLVGLEADNAALRDRIDALEWLREVESIGVLYMHNPLRQRLRYAVQKRTCRPDDWVHDMMEGLEREHKATIEAAREAVEA